MKIKNIEEILNRWTDKIYPSRKKFLEALNSRKLVIYHGVDPTAPDLHLGHSTNYLLLRKFQDLGHKIILLMGDFTAQIGDPTGKISARKPLTKRQVLKNCKTYKEQVGKILDFKSKKNPVQIKFNSQWLGNMKLENMMELMAKFTQGQMIKRNMFQERLKKGQEIYLTEFLYPLLQGYDSVAMNVDVEVGGTDQTFNMLVGRKLMRKYQQKEKFVITTPLLENPKTGKKLMSKSEGGYIALSDSPNQMYGKIMALPDEVIIPCFKLCTRVPLDEIKKTDNPRDLKTRLAEEIVRLYYDGKTAAEAEKEFNKVFKEKKLPTRIPEIKIKEKKLFILDLLTKTKLVISKSEAKRLILQKGVKINGKIQEDWKAVIEIKKGLIIQIGKRKFVKLK
ncbi:MAG: tyrosine--tRNA ligase [Candidatus Nealsonbacteria bacterium CG10_big_fil_rev_8_21_14_0_10_36_24]|uniref:Tyrosine--tRNA ligase n=2 Tax=Candidatus Nealsoniibacteriota TaxID=1817911 RepID=A0A2H0YPN9_9BACT|nr:MAG: tyrosine--tRNA ligase [Candidatus Nealsonbacteria bacterium CG10_big_fil_rev_8_21_14_0_10_36_24]PIS40386.1 MAG: tyrosine--tRNA ligase [Candidatus Nealsonbacteria bacterium CG08_land_8_20_14_0_20_36_22]